MLDEPLMVIVADALTMDSPSAPLRLRPFHKLIPPVIPMGRKLRSADAEMLPEVVDESSCPEYIKNPPAV